MGRRGQSLREGVGGVGGPRGGGPGVGRRQSGKLGNTDFEETEEAGRAREKGRDGCPRGVVSAQRAAENGWEREKYKCGRERATS